MACIRFLLARETAEAVNLAVRLHFTPLKRGVNESRRASKPTRNTLVLLACITYAALAHEALDSVPSPHATMKSASASNKGAAKPALAPEAAVTPAGTPSAEAVQRAGVACVKRLPAYLQMLRVLQGEGQEYVSGTVLATTHHLEPVIVRKDLAVTGVVGTPRRGFHVAELIAAIEKFLGWDNQTKAVLVGVGNLGTALLGYQGFEHFGLRIAGAFDRDPAKLGQWINGRKVQPLHQLPAFVKRGNIRLGVLTVPAAAAQETADLMVQAGIRGIWNFSPAKLVLPEGVVTQKEDLAEGLAVLSHRLKQPEPKR